jgi:chemotaxis regulatin CheY-phosphate phosphatase CheZ
MSNPIVHAFFVGRALAETVYEQAEASLTDVLSELGKLDAELRENLRDFTEQVMERAQQEEQIAMERRSTVSAPAGAASVDLQTVIDELRAEIARLRSELKQYRSRTL